MMYRMHPLMYPNITHDHVQIACGRLVNIYYAVGSPYIHMCVIDIFTLNLTLEYQDFEVLQSNLKFIQL